MMFAPKVPEEFLDDPVIQHINRKFRRLFKILFVCVAILLIGNVFYLKYWIRPRTGKTKQVLNHARKLHLKNQFTATDTWGNNLRLINSPQEVEKMVRSRVISRDHQGARFIIYSFGPDEVDDHGGGDDLVVSDKRAFVR